MTNLEFGSILTYARSFLFFYIFIKILNLTILFSFYLDLYFNKNNLHLFFLMQSNFSLYYLAPIHLGSSLFFFTSHSTPNFFVFFPFYYFPILLHITKVLKIMKKMEKG
jgi:hypothetical protein